MTTTPYMPDGQPAPAVMTIEEAAKFLRLDEFKYIDSCLRTLRARGLRTVKLGGRVRFPLTEVMAFVERELETNPR